MLFVAAALVVIGAAVALMGERAFRVLLPILGFIAGIMVGFSGVQAIFGIGVVSLPIAIIVGVLVGALMAVLSYLFFNLAVTIYAAVLLAYGFMYLGIALGLGDNGFWLTLLAFAGGVLGLAVASMLPLGRSLVIFVTSFFGVAMILAGVLLAAGSISLDQLQNSGILRAVNSTVSNQLVWLFVWVGGGLVASHMQIGVIERELMSNKYSYEAQDSAN